jgi:hypothetical protein
MATVIDDETAGLLVAESTADPVTANPAPEVTVVSYYPVADDAVAESDDVFGAEDELEGGPKPVDIPIAYADQVFLEPVNYGAYGTYNQGSNPWGADQDQMFMNDQDDYKDLVSFVFIVLLGFICVVILFYPFSYYDDDYVSRALLHKYITLMKSLWLRIPMSTLTCQFLSG